MEKEKKGNDNDFITVMNIIADIKAVYCKKDNAKDCLNICLNIKEGTVCENLEKIVIC